VAADDLRDLISQKRAGGAFSSADTARIVAALLDPRASRAQLAALVTTGVLLGFDEQETVRLTEALVASGEVLNLPPSDRPAIDKHSTGGVGDTVTLVLAPLLAACGARVVKLSGRALGHTGGTIDKLEAIPGLRTDLTPAEVAERAERVGVVVAAAGPGLAPADRELYALRDHIAMVDDVALIASSVMSKKIAAGAEHILLDVKTGDGALLDDPAQAEELARSCVRIGQAHGRRTAALVTDMSQPLGPAIGDTLEVIAAIELLASTEQPGSSGPQARLRTLVTELAVVGLRLAGIEDAAPRVEAALAGGAALERLEAMIHAQGGDPGVVSRPRAGFAAAPVVRDWTPGPGTVVGIGCRGLGELVHELAARSRDREEAQAAGLEVRCSLGDTLAPEQVAVRIHAPSAAAADAAEARLGQLVRLGRGPVEVPPLIHARI
jgi:pyrimidine-nucleoside phosphorylase